MVRPLKRLLDTWDRNESTSGPSPWKIDGNGDYYYYYYDDNKPLPHFFSLCTIVALPDDCSNYRPKQSFIVLHVVLIGKSITNIDKIGAVHHDLRQVRFKTSNQSRKTKRCNMLQINCTSCTQSAVYLLTAYHRACNRAACHGQWRNIVRARQTTLSGLELAWLPIGQLIRAWRCRAAFYMVMPLIFWHIHPTLTVGLLSTLQFSRRRIS
jgi:hypothetical protein